MSSITDTQVAPSVEPASWRQPLTVALASVLATATFVLLGADAEALLGAFCAAVLVWLSAIDLEQQILPNRIVFPAAAFTLVAHVAVAPAHAVEWIGWAFGAAAALAFPLVFSRNGMGLGDVKLALLLGAWLGSSVLGALFIAFVATLPVSLFLLARHGAEARKRTFPFGPFLAFGTIAVTLAGAV